MPRVVGITARHRGLATNFAESTIQQVQSHQGATLKSSEADTLAVLGSKSENTTHDFMHISVFHDFLVCSQFEVWQKTHTFGCFGHLTTQQGFGLSVAKAERYPQLSELVLEATALS